MKKTIGNHIDEAIEVALTTGNKVAHKGTKIANRIKKKIKHEVNKLK